MTCGVRSASTLVRVLLFGPILLVVPAAAEAQWYAGAFLGANHTQSATVQVDQPTTPFSVEFHDVEFEAKPFASPQYYGWRFGRLFGEGRRLGVELEFIHLKVIAKTDRIYEIHDRTGLLLLAPDTPMSALVERYSMTHGLNFLLVNLVGRHPVGAGRLTLVGRLGTGPTLPHAETTVLGRSQSQYEYAGMGAALALGTEIHLRGRLSGLVEYKATYARPEIRIAGGTGRTNALSHQIAFGLSYGLSR